MHRAFTTERDYEVYESPERAAQRRQNDREVEMATAAHHPQVPGSQPRPELKPSQIAFPSDRLLSLNEAAQVADRYRKAPPATMDTGELSKGSNLPHRDDKDVSTWSRDASAKTGYYQAGTDAFSSDAHMGKESPIARKARTGTFRNGKGETYVVPHGLHSSYRETVVEESDENGETKTSIQAPHEAGRWGKALTSRNKHLAYWRDPTSREALANLAGHGTERDTPGDYFTLEIPREFLVMFARFHDLQVKRGRIDDNGRGETLREVAKRVPEGTVIVDLYSPSDVLNLAQGIPKRYKTGEFGQLLKDLVTHAKITK